MSLFSQTIFCGDAGDANRKMLRHRGPNLISSRPIHTIELRRHSAPDRFSFAQKKVGKPVFVKKAS